MCTTRFFLVFGFFLAKMLCLLFSFVSVEDYCASHKRAPLSEPEGGISRYSGLGFHFSAAITHNRDNTWSTLSYTLNKILSFSRLDRLDFLKMEVFFFFTGVYILHLSCDHPLSHMKPLSLYIDGFCWRSILKFTCLLAVFI